MTLVEKARVAKSGMSTYINQLLAPVPEDKFEVCRQEMAEWGTYLNDQEWVEILLQEEGHRIHDLVSWDVPFEKDEQGKLRVTRGRGHQNTGVVHCDGHKLMELLRDRLLATGVELRERSMITDLLTSDGRSPTSGEVVGAMGFHTRSRDFVAFQAKAMVITSGAIGLKLRIPFTNNLTGDGGSHSLPSWSQGQQPGVLFLCPPDVFREEVP